LGEEDAGSTRWLSGGNNIRDLLGQIPTPPTMAVDSSEEFTAEVSGAVACRVTARGDS
jgi:hypothetical protein